MSRAVVEVVLWVEMLVCVVIGSKITRTGRQVDALILSSDMVRHKVDDDFHPSEMRAADKLLKLTHAIGHVNGKVRIDVIIVYDSVWRTCFALDHRSMLPWYAILCVVCRRGMSQQACIPDMGKAHLMDFPQAHGVEIVHLPHSILGKRTILLASRITVAEKSRENLVNYCLLVHQIELWSLAIRSRQLLRTS